MIRRTPQDFWFQIIMILFACVSLLAIGVVVVERRVTLPESVWR